MRTRRALLEAAIERCAFEQLECAERLASGFGGPGARPLIVLGLHDWTIEEMLLREELAAL